MTMPNIAPLPEQPQVFDISNANVSQGQDINAPTGITNISQLPAPLLEAIMQSIAYQICSDSKDSTDRIKEILDEAEQNQK